MAGTWIGADPQQLSSLGTTLKNQATPIQEVISTVTGVLEGTTWQGPARDYFVQEWNGSFKGALNNLIEAFGVAGQDCLARSEELARVMGR